MHFWGGGIDHKTVDRGYSVPFTGCANALCLWALTNSRYTGVCAIQRCAGDVPRQLSVARVTVLMEKSPEDGIPGCTFARLAGI